MMKHLTLLRTSLILLLLATCMSVSADGHNTKTLQGLPVSGVTNSELLQLNAGFAAVENGKTLAASKIFDQLLEGNGSLAMAHIGKIINANSAEAFAEAVRHAIKVEGMTDAESMIVKINNSYIQGDAEKRLSLSQDLVTQYPKSHRAWIIRGNSLTSQNLTEEARKAYEKAIELAPHHVSGYMQASNHYLFFAPKDFDKAESLMRKAATHAPNNARVLIMLGDVYRAKSQLKEALVHYELASLIEPQMTTAHAKMGHANTFIGNFEAARQNYEAAARVADLTTPAQYGNFRAYTYLYDGDPQKAHATLSEWLSALDSKDMEPAIKMQSKVATLIDMAMTALHNQLTEAAKDDIARLSTVMDEQIRAVNEETFSQYQKSFLAYLKGFHSLQSGDVAMAKKHAEKMWELMEPMEESTKHEQYHLLMGQILLADGENQDALKHLQQSDAENIYVKYLMSKAYRNMNDDSKAAALIAELEDYNFNNIEYALVRHEVTQ